MPGTGELRRSLGVRDATAIGLGSMLGAGVFVVFAPAAALAGPWLLFAVVLAGAVAYANAVASAQLASVYPASGGSYVYGRKQLGQWPGFIAGWGFVTGKTASCAAMALVFAGYLAPGFKIPVAIAAVVALTVVNLFGITRTALLTRILLALTLATLVFVLIACLLPYNQSVPAAASSATTETLGSFWGIFPAAGLMFFAFAGYARIATLGEEVRDPARTIPKAILGALAGALLLYLVITIALSAHLGTAQLAGSSAPLLTAVEHSPLSPAAPIVQAGAAAASLGALLALVTGVGRTSLAMAREGDLPKPLARVSHRLAVPYVAEISVAVVVILLLLGGTTNSMIGFSSFGVLVYYAVTNLAAMTLSERPSWGPKWLNLVGLCGCVLLALTLPWQSSLGMTAVLLLGIAARWVLRTVANLRNP
ncbi:APC family permease [Pseudarthrobacter sp. J1738]|uniref:APC family permease n=1 Tax=Pseudarthrobacter sp. J1738 TaxID=3420446 RepID=UPI003D2DE224